MIAKKKKIVVLTGAGISAESGIPTFRDSGGLWEGYDVNEVATPDGWRKNPELVLEFYDQRRDAIRKAQSNVAHLALTKLQKDYHLVVVTQNIDDLHERAGTKNIIHLHGEIMNARSSTDFSLLYPLKDKNIAIGDKCTRGSQLRPDVVWFGEAVPKMEDAIREAEDADIFIVIGTSMLVYPAAGLGHYTSPYAEKYIIDPKIEPGLTQRNLVKIEKKATEGVPELVVQLLHNISKQK